MGESYEDEVGFCKLVKFEEIEKYDFVLMLGCYVGVIE